MKWIDHQWSPTLSSMVLLTINDKKLRDHMWGLIPWPPTLSDGVGLMKREEPALSEELPLSPVIQSQLQLVFCCCCCYCYCYCTVSPGSCCLSCWAAAVWFNSAACSWRPVSKLWLLKEELLIQAWSIKRQDADRNAMIIPPVTIAVSIVVDCKRRWQLLL